MLADGGQPVGQVGERANEHRRTRVDGRAVLGADDVHGAERPVDQPLRDAGGERRQHERDDYLADREVGRTAHQTR